MAGGHNNGRPTSSAVLGLLTPSFEFTFSRVLLRHSFIPCSSVSSLFKPILMSSLHPRRLRRYQATIDYVTSGMDYLCGRTANLVLQPAPVHPGNQGQVRCRTRATPGNNVPSPRPTPVASTKEIITPALTTFWATFDLDQPRAARHTPRRPLGCHPAEDCAMGC